MIEEILKKSLVCRVAFHGEEFPYVVPMNFGYHEQALYFHCANEGKKLQLIAQNPKVAFEITEENQLKTGLKSCEWTTAYRSIMGIGTMEVITDFTQKVRGLDVLMHHHGKLKNAYEPALVNRLSILKLTILEMTAKENG